MRRIVLWVSSTLTVLVLLLGYRTSLAGPLAGSTGPTAYSAGTVTTGTSTAASSSAATSGSTGAARTVTGDAVQTRYGPVQVELTVSGDRITGARVLQSPAGDPRSAEISGYALPRLLDQTVADQGSVDMVSGATYTSTGYEQSLQSALDGAGL